MDKKELKKIIEGALLAYGQPLSVDKLQSLFVVDTELEDESAEAAPEVTKEDIKIALEELQQECDERGYELKQVASGWRFQVREEAATWVNRLWEEKPQRYSRALMETLAIIAYRQPVTRGDIEEIRGVAVSSNIIKTLSEREWVKVVGHRDVPGRPSLYATTKTFLDYFNLKSLEELPSLKELTDIESLTPELALTDEPKDASVDEGVAETSISENMEVIEQEPDNDAPENEEKVIH